MTMLTTLYCLFKLEFIHHFRHSQEWLYPAAFFLLLILIFPMVIPADSALLLQYLPGEIWLSSLFASLLAIQSIFISDLEDLHFEQLLLSRIPLPIIIVIKIITYWLLTLLPLLWIMPFIALIFHFSLPLIACITLSLCLGTLIFTLIGSFIMALMLGLRQGGILLGLLLLPLCIPVLFIGLAIIEEVRLEISVLSAFAFLGGMLVLFLTVIPVAISYLLTLYLED